jgi:hypothetical protein
LAEVQEELKVSTMYYYVLPLATNDDDLGWEEGDE